MPETQEIVINTGPMIAIVAAMGDLKVLKIYTRVCVPLEVCGEVTTGASKRFAAVEFEDAHWLEKWKQPLSPLAVQFWLLNEPARTWVGVIPIRKPAPAGSPSGPADPTSARR